MNTSTLTVLLFSSILLYIQQLCNSSILNEHLRVRLKNDDHGVDLSKLRYLILGESFRCGTATRLQNLKEGYYYYPTLLSPNVTNLSMDRLALGPNLPSVCTQSLISDDAVYDVIILDYILSYDDGGLDVLTQRLRARFPDAIIILNMMWVPKLIIATDKNNQVFSFDEIWKKYNFTSPMTSQHISTLRNSDIIKFELNPKFHKEHLILLKKIKNTINGHLFGLDQFRSVYWEKKDWVLQRLNLFSDLINYSERGHVFVAHGIKKALIKLRPKLSNKLGAWADSYQDSCNLWYNTGKVSVAYSPGRIILLKEFSPNKYALEIPSEGGQIAINNPFPQSRQLLVSYMASAASGNTFVVSNNYPKVEIKLSHATDKSFIIHPTTTTKYDYHYQKEDDDDDLVMTADLGFIPPGQTRIYIKPICPESSSCVLPFRLVGASITGRNSVKTKFDTPVVFVKPVDLLWGKPEKIVDKNDRKQDDEIRYASFGSSVTFGAGLQNRETECYVWKLSNLDYQRGMNYAIRSSGPNYPSSCVRSMMKDEEFDVIILEFFMRAMDGLKTLATRIRHRFPGAIIIILKLWGPYQFGSAELKIHDLSLWAFNNGFGTNFIHDPKFKSALLVSGAHKWSYRFHDRSKDPLVQYQQQAAKEAGAYIVKMPISDYAEGPGGWLELGQKLLASDSFHLSEAGHQSLADQVKAIVDRVGVPKKRVVKPFAAIDQCYNWFTSGSIGKGVKYSINGVVQKMPNTDKYVLSFTKFDVDHGKNWIRVDNPTDAKLEFLIGYMTTGPPPSKYPKVQAVLNGKQFELQPDAVGWRDRKVHIVRMASLGTIDPHSSAQVNFRPLEKSEYPFRLVQVILTPVSDNNDERSKSLTGRGMSSEISVL